MKIVTKPFDNNTLRKLYDFLLQYYDSGYIWALQKKQHEFLLEHCGYNSNVCNSMWKLIVLERGIQSKKDLGKIIKDILNELDSTNDIFKACSRYKIQPIFLKDKIDKKYFTEEYGYKEKYDLFSKYHGELARTKGEEFETLIKKSLMTTPYTNFITEKEQKKKNPTNNSNGTPDFLYKETIDFFKYKGINWIEVKSYPGIYDAIKYYGVLKQVKRYTSSYGKGLLLVNHGFSKSFKDLIERKTNNQVIVLALK